MTSPGAMLLTKTLQSVDSTELTARAHENKVNTTTFSCLSDKAILSHMDKGTVVISPFHPSHLSTSSYDVTLGKYFYRESDYEPGLSIFNPYSREMVEKVWGQAHLAENAGEWMKRTKIKLENIDEKDDLIWLKPGETILGHTNEFIGGKGSVTTMMKARSSMGRTFIETCKCFPKETRLLTRDGFKFVACITEEDEVATYNPDTDQIEYHHPTMMMKKSGTHEMIEVEKTKYTDNLNISKECNIHLSTTDDHRWYVRTPFGLHEEVCKPKRCMKYASISANVLFDTLEETDSFTVLNSAGKGLGDPCIKPQIFFQFVEFQSEDEIQAFMSFYGYWLYHGYLDESDNVCIRTHINDRSTSYIVDLLKIMRLDEGTGFTKDADSGLIQLKGAESIRSKGFLFSVAFRRDYGKYFHSLQTERMKEEKKEDKAVEKSTRDDVDGEKDTHHSEKEKEFGFFDWAQDLLPKYIHILVFALIRAGGNITDPSIFHPSSRFRDQLMQILIHGGYAPHFTKTITPNSTNPVRLEGAIQNDTSDRGEKDGWKIFLGTEGESELNKKDNFLSYSLQGDVYCITVPNHLVFAQTARCDKEGVVESCTQPVIVSNCAGWGDIGFTNRWAMEITNNSRYYSIPLVVGRRIAQIVFFDTDGTNNTTYEISGKYQKGSELEDIKRNWKPEDLLPKMFMDREIVQGPTKDVLGDGNYGINVQLTMIVDKTSSK